MMDPFQTRVPLEFVGILPEGIKYFSRHGKDFLVVENVLCPNGHSLMADAVRINGEPTIRMGVEIGPQKGNFFIDSFWGSHEKLYDFIPALNAAPVVVKAQLTFDATGRVDGVYPLPDSYAARTGRPDDEAYEVGTLNR